MPLPLFYKVFSSPSNRPDTKHVASEAEITQHVVLLHGYFASHTNMTGILHQLTALFGKKAVKFILIDIRNHGRSPHSHDLSYTAMAEDIEALLNELHIENIILIGHSMGGKIAMTMTLRKNIHVTKLIVADIAPCAYSKPYSEDYIEALTHVELSQFSSRETVSAHLEKSIPNKTLRDFLLKNLRADKGGLHWQCNLPVLYEKRFAIIAAVPQATESMREEKASAVLFIRGATSPYIGEKEKPSLSEYFPQHKLITFADTGHWVHYEQPKRFAETCYTFIQA